MIAVHCGNAGLVSFHPNMHSMYISGAGRHSEKNHLKFKKLCNKACRAGMKVISKGGSALDAVKAAVIVLENDPLTNAGYGSNLTTAGIVECDAAVMDGETLLFGGCGSVRRIQNPVDLAHGICVKQLEELPLGLVAPSLLVGSGAVQYARKLGIKLTKNKYLKSAKAQKQFKKYIQFLNSEEVDCRLDTVGAVCCDENGRVASACSSGGLLLKTPGRVGQAALYASGVWADNFSKDKEPSTAVCTTGCGEHLVQTQLAKVISDDLKMCSCPTTALSKCMMEKFINSKYLHRVHTKSGGALVLHISKTGEGSVLWGHSTETMSVGYMRRCDVKPKSLISQLPKNVDVGSTVTVGGCNFDRT